MLVVKSYNPEQPYTARLNKILEEYPDGTQVLREILQNSDDAGGTRQDFVLDYNTYGHERLYDKNLARYQGPALLSLNDSSFREEDFNSLVRLEDSVKKREFSKIGAMGLGFNSVYHLTDAPFLISGESFIFFDPHRRGYFDMRERGYMINYVEENLQTTHPDHFHPFLKTTKIGYKGTTFRYPLRTKSDAKESDISQKIYEPKEILEMFKKFYEFDNIYCMIFLKTIKEISFYQIKEGSKVKELLYKIELTNNDEIKERRIKIANDIPTRMESLPSLSKKAPETKESTISTESIKMIYKVNFKLESFIDNEIKSSSSEWLIVNYLADVKETDDHFRSKFKKSIHEYKFVPNVALAARIDKVSENRGGLFCFLPIPGIIKDFSVLVNGYFAVSKNRRNIETHAEDDLAENSLPRLRVYWNKYLFTKVLPNVWETFINESCKYVKNDDIYTIWPTSINVKQSSSGSSRSILWKDLLRDVIKLLNPDLRIYRGPSTKLNSNIGYLSLKNGYLIDETYENFEKISTILENIGFPLFVKMPKSIIEALKNSVHKKLVKYITPELICKYLSNGISKWETYWDYDTKIEILEYVIRTQNPSSLYNLPLIPLSNKTFGTFQPKTKKAMKFLCRQGEQDIIDQRLLNHIVDNEIKKEIWKGLCKIARTYNDINISLLDDHSFFNFLKYSITESSNPEIQINKSQVKFIYKVWNHFVDTERDLEHYEDLHLLIVQRKNNLYLRKLNAEPKCLKYDHNNSDLRETAKIFELLKVDCLEEQFLKCHKVLKWEDFTNYLIDIDDDKIEVLNILNPNNTHVDFDPMQIDLIVDYISVGLKKKKDISKTLKKTIEHLRIFKELNNNLSNTSISSSLSNNNSNTLNFLLPVEEEKSRQPIITRSDVKFWDINHPKDIRFILENILKIPKLDQKDYFLNHVIPYLDKVTPIDKVNQIIVNIFSEWHSLVWQQAVMLDRLKQIRIVKIRDTGDFENDFKKPCEIYTKNSSKSFINLFFSDEIIYPIEHKMIPNYLNNIETLDVKSSLTVKDLVDRINLYLDKIKHGEDLYKKTLSLLTYIDQNHAKISDMVDKSQLYSLIRNKSWIPAVKSEIDGSQEQSYYYKKPSECFDGKYKQLVFYTEPIVEYKVTDVTLRQILKWNEPPPLSRVIDELLINIKEYNNSIIKRNFVLAKKKHLTEKIELIYTHFEDVIDENSNLEILKSKLKDKCWILNNGEFYETRKLFFNENTVPGYIIKLSYYNQSKHQEFFKKMGVKNESDVAYVIYVIGENIKEIKKDKEATSNSNNKNYSPLYEKLAIIKSSKSSSLTKENLSDIEELLIPNMNDGFVKIKDALFDDMGNNFIKTVEKKNILVHDSISKNVTSKLSIKNLSEVIIKQANIGLEKFGQHEALTARLNKIIKNDYREEVVFQEFLQNADDAKATRFSIIIDNGQYNNDPKKASLLSRDKGLEHWQGPSILIYNDMPFSEEDLVKICELGTGSKGDDYTKIGKFGLGFNSCYNYTDLPSFITGKYIVIFDPHQKYLQDGYPGNKLDFLENNHMITQFYDQFEPFDNFALNNEDPGFKFDKAFNGTLFRLPLRNINCKSKISTKIHDISTIKELLCGYRYQMLSELIFLRNIKSIEVYEKSGKTFPPSLTWQVDATNISNEDFRTDLGSYSSLNYLSTRLFENGVKNAVISTDWLIYSSGMDEEIEDKSLKEYSIKHKLNHSSGIAMLLKSDFKRNQDKISLVGKIYSNLSLPLRTGLEFNLNSCGWELSSDRKNIQLTQQSLFDGKALWNNFILNKILPMVYIKAIKSRIDNCDKSKYQQFISEYWPIQNPYVSFGSNVLKLISDRDDKVFWSKLDGGKFVGLKEAYIGDNSVIKVVIDYLLANGEAVVILSPNELKDFNDHNIVYNKVDVKLVIRVLKKYNFTSCDYGHSLKIKLLKYILEDDNYDLNGISLVPLFDDTFGTFGDYFSMTNDHIMELFPKGKLGCFISTKKLKVYDLFNQFQNEGFQKSTNIQNFNPYTISKVLEADLPRGSYIDYKPDSPKIPCKYWLDGIWRIIDQNQNIDQSLNGFPLIEICDNLEYNEFKSNKLISLEEARRKIPLSKSTDDEFNKILVKINIRIATEWSQSLQNYVSQYNKINLIISLHNYDCYDDIGLLSEKDIDYFRTNISLNLLNDLNNSNKRLEMQNVLANLPVWKIHSTNLRYQKSSDYNVYLLPAGIPYFDTKTDTLFVDLKNQDKTIAKCYSLKERSLFDYITKDILPYIKTNMSEDLKEKYINLLNLTFKKCNGDLIHNLKEKAFLPNTTFEKLYFARDLYNSNNNIFKDLFQKKHLHPSLQSNSKSLEVLTSMGFINNLNGEDTFIKCAEEIEILSSNTDKSIINNLIRVSENLLEYLYANINNGLKPEKDKLLNIKFVPISRYALNAPYKEHGCKLSDESQVFECFNNLALKKNLELCWTQKFFYSEKVEPKDDFLKIYEEIEKPSIETVFKHLKRIADDIIKSDDWRQNNLLFKAIDKIYGYFESLCDDDDDGDGDLLKSLFNNKRLILNGKDPCETNNWVEGKHLVKEIGTNIDSERRAIAKYLLKYPKFLELVGAVDLKIPSPPPLPSLESTSDSPGLIKNYKIYETLLDALEIKDSVLNNITFEINEEKISANLYILAISSKFFDEQYLQNGKLNSTYPLTEINNVQPNFLRIIIRILYGQNFDDAVKFVFSKDDLETDDLFECLRLSSLLQISNLNEYLECKLCSILASNLHKFKEFFKKASEQKYKTLNSYCEKISKENPKVMD